MAQLASDFHFTGSLGNLSAYRMRGVDKIILRKKGGASKEKIHRAPSFENTRRLNKEFGGRARAVRWLRGLLFPLKAIADYNFSGPLNGLLKHVQGRDSVSEFGRRNILFSQYGSLLQGFSLNRSAALETLIATPLVYTVSKETLSAKVEIPELVPDVTFFPDQKHPLFRIVAVLGVAPDLYCTDYHYEPLHPDFGKIRPATEATRWLYATQGSPATTLELKLTDTPPSPACSLVLSIGLCFGSPRDAERIDQIKYAGAARIVAVVGA